MLAGNADETATAAALQQMWSAVGVKLTLQQLDNATRTDRYRKGDFQMRLGAWTDDIPDPSEITSYFVYNPNIQAQHSGWKNDEADKLFEQSQQETDPAKRAAQYKRIQEIYMAEAPMLFIYETPYPVVLQQKVKGFIRSRSATTSSSARISSSSVQEQRGAVGELLGPGRIAVAAGCRWSRRCS